MTSTTGKLRRAPSLTIAAWLAAAGALGSVLLSVGHAGVAVPLLSRIGPGGSRAVVPAAVAFGVGALLYALVSAGLFAARRWASWAGVALFALTLVFATTPWRGAGSAAGAVLAIAGLVALGVAVSRPSARGRSRP